MDVKYYKMIQLDKGKKYTKRFLLKMEEDVL